MNDRHAEKLDDLMDRYVFGLVGSVEADRVRRKIESDPEWQLAYEAAVQRKRALAGGVRADAARSKPPRRFRPDHIIAAARAREAREKRTHRFVRGSFGGIAAAAAIIIAVSWIRVAVISPPTHTIRLLGQTQLMAGSVASLRAFVSNLAGDFVGGVPVRLVLSDRRTGSGVVLANWVTDDSGAAAGQVNVPDWGDGDYTLTATAGEDKSAVIEVPITIRRASKVYLSTDKPIYQPGQTIHMRCMILRKPTLRPDAGGRAEFSVTDPAGNVIFRQPAELSEFGIASVDLPLDVLINTGRYTVEVAADGDASEQVVEIFHYKLPAFAVKVKLDKPYYLPGKTVTGTVDVRYHFGKPVAGASVALELAERYLAKPEPLRSMNVMNVTTDAEGKAGFRIDLPRTLFGSRATSDDAHLLLSARATDSAGQENVAYRTVVVADQDIRIAVVAENGLDHPGIDSRVFVVTSYPDGRPAEAIVDIESIARSVRTNKAGVAVVTMRNVPDPFRVSARDSAGRTGSVELSLPRAGGDAFVLRTDKPTYSAGETISVEVVAARAGEVFLDVIKDRQTMLTRTLEVADGRGRLTVDLPPELAGTLRLHAYRLDDEGEWVGRDVLVVVRPAGRLKVEVSGNRDVHRPGEDANLVFRVTDTAGKGVPSALGLSAVDEAVYSVQQAAPGLEETLAGLDAEILTPAVQAHKFSPALMSRDRDYAEAVLAAVAGAAAEQDTAKRSRLKELEETGYMPRGMLERWNRSEIKRAIRENPELVEQLDPELVAELVEGRAGTGTGTHSLDLDNEDDAKADYYRHKRGARDTADKLSLIVGGVGALAFLLLAVFWYAGTTDRSTSPGNILLHLLLIVLFVVLLVSTLVPSLTRARALSYQAKISADLRAVGMAQAMREADEEDSGGYNHGCESILPQPAEGGQVRLRTYFPETMLWRPQLITDEHGRADLTVPLADSITMWRLSGSAVSRVGGLGSIHSSIRVFQPFFVDINAPASLTAGDEVSVPLVLYNYTPGELKVSLRAEASAALTVLANAEQEVALRAGEVRRAFVRLRAGSIGAATLTVNASAGSVADAIRRPIRVVPPGLPQSLSVNGTIRDGDQFVDVAIPADAVPGSVAVRMKLYPSTFSELIDGLEGILAKPYGCFEQTTSATYPNVMALAYMKSRRIDSPETVARARRYVHLGYQRMLSFEATGGGFSLYGSSPANPPLTAYGMMLFADMAKVHNVGPGVMSRAVRWLAKNQEANGSWRGYLPMGYATGDGDSLAITAYVTWAVAAFDPRSTSARRGADYVAARIGEARDAHTLALCVNALLSVDKNNRTGLAGAARLARLADRSEPGRCRWSARSAPLSYCRGEFGDVETTSLAVLALTKARRDAPLVHDALRWIASMRDGCGTWGTTQPTVLALKALLAGSTAPTRRSTQADVSVAVADPEPGRDGRLANVTIRPDQSDVVRSVKLTSLTEPGRHRLRMTARQAAGMAYQFVVRYHSEAAAKAPAAGRGLAISVNYDRTQLETGGVVKVRAVVANNADTPAKMPLADIGTPPGFVVRPAGLDRLQAAGKIERYTLTARGVIVYMKDLPSQRSVSIGYEMTARMPIRAVAAPTTVYPYYQPDQQSAATPATFVVE